MSYHVYIALEGFKETPIPIDAWLAAARQCDEVVVEEEQDRHGETYHSVILKGDKRARLDRTPYGVILAQDPSKELVVAMFKIAQTLNAGVYSERLKRYNSLDDWERRTAKYRGSLSERRANFKSTRRLRLVFWIAVVAVSAALGWLAAEFRWFAGGR